MRLRPVLGGRIQGVFIATAATALLVAVLAPFRNDLGLLNLGFLFLMLTLLIAANWGREIGLYAAVLTNLAFNYFFIEPLHRFSVEEPRNVFALAVFLAVSIIGGSLLSTARRAAEAARQRQAEAEVALALSREMSGQREPQGALSALCRQVLRAFAAPGASVLAADGDWSVLAWAGAETAARAAGTEERLMAEQAVAQDLPAGFGDTGLARPRRIVFPAGRRDAYPRRDVAFVPLKVGEEVLGVLRLDGPIGATPFRADPLHLLSAVAAEAALAVQRVQLSNAAAHAEALREADELKTALMASISHDLKTPLAAIKASISNILDSSVAWTPADIEAFHRTIDAQADRLDRVISDILDLNRIESGALIPEQAPIRVLELLQSACEVTSFETRGREVILDASPALRAVADESLIRQAVVNLIENAAKYSRGGGAIRLAASTAGDGQVEIVVEDDGPGIAPPDLPHVFDRFYRAAEPSRRVRGSGLGLTIVKGFVDLCGGSVSVESSPSGTRFTIRLPATQPAGVAG